MLTPEVNRMLTDTNPGTPMGELFRRFWMPFLMADELPAPDCVPVRVRLLGEDLVAFKDSQGRIGLLDALCPHRLAPLFFGRNEECGLRCAYHGWKYDVDGNCVDMPSEPPGSGFKEKIEIKRYNAVESGGFIWAYMGPPEQEPELPDLELRLVPDSQRYVVRYDVDSNYMQAMEGDDDSSHVSFLHSTLNRTLDSGGRLGQKYSTHWMDDKAPRLHVKETEYGLITGSQRDAGEEHYYWRITPWLMPFYSIIPQEPGQPLLCNVRIPRDNETSLFFRVMYHPTRSLSVAELYNYKHMGEVYSEAIAGTNRAKANIDNDYLIDRALQRRYSFTGIKGIPNQDRAMTDGMGAIVDRSREHLGTSDTTIIRMRQRLLRAAKALEEGTEPLAAASSSAYRVRSVATVLPREVQFDEGAADYLLARTW